MKDPTRLMDGDGNELQRWLLSEAASEEPSPELERLMLAPLHLTFPPDPQVEPGPQGRTPSQAPPPAGAPAPLPSMTPGAAVFGGVSLWPWIGISVVALGAAMGGAYLLRPIDPLQALGSESSTNHQPEASSSSSTPRSVIGKTGVRRDDPVSLSDPEEGRAGPGLAQDASAVSARPGEERVLRQERPSEIAVAEGSSGRMTRAPSASGAPGSKASSTSSDSLDTRLPASTNHIPSASPPRPRSGGGPVLRPEVATERTANSSPASLRDELALLDPARSALQGKDAKRALSLLDRYQAKFPAGVLLQEATVLRLEAMKLQGQLGHVQHLQEQFIADHPESAHIKRIESQADAD